MQGLPFDETDFPQPGVTVSMSSTWMESPRGMAAAAAAAAASANVQNLQPPNSSNPIAIDEEMYGMVGTSPQSGNPTNVLPHFSPQAMQHRAISQQRQQRGQQHHQQTNPSQQQQPHPSQNPQQSPSFSQAHMILPQQPTHRQLQSPNPHMQIHQVTHDPTMNAPGSRMSVRRRSRGGLPEISDEVVGKTEATVAMEHGLPLTALTAPKRKIIRSAVEEARLRAQREAESFAHSRRDSSKRDGAGKSMDTGWETGSTERRGKRTKTDVDIGIDVRKGGGSTTSAVQGEEGGAKKEEDSEVEKQERYKRRLDMNRESAAVSRVRRRAYVKELEERLAAVEAEKLQLEGKLEIMLSQNEDLKKQLDRLFMMVASGRRPTYPPQEEGPGQQ